MSNSQMFSALCCGQSTGWRSEKEPEVWGEGFSGDRFTTAPVSVDCLGALGSRGTQWEMPSEPSFSSGWILPSGRRLGVRRGTWELGPHHSWVPWWWATDQAHSLPFHVILSLTV